MKFIQITEKNLRFTATMNGGTSFYVGRRVSYEGDVGITNDSEGKGARYRPEDYPAAGHWAPFIYPTAVCESYAYFTNVNTYDSARFTFGFFQLAAHVADGDFVRFFRALLGTPSGSDYFPDLSMQDGRIFRDTPAGPRQLESKDSSVGLMDYLNPSTSAVEPIEVINSAKLIDGANQFVDQRQAQVDEALSTARRTVASAAKNYGLDGMGDIVCLIVMDIRHQGRGGSQAIMQALHSSADEKTRIRNLLKIGWPKYKSRLETLEKEINRLAEASVLGTKIYRQATNDFA